jgi:hypothetical protein
MATSVFFETIRKTLTIKVSSTFGSEFVLELLRKKCHPIVRLGGED